MNDYIFRAYDIRGKVGSEFTIKEGYQIAQAIVYYLKKKDNSLKRIAVGADGRTHSPALTKEICTAIQEAGIDVVFIGVCPTPVLYFSQHQLPVDAGIMITASHNGKEYNGFKIVHKKKSVWGQDLQEILSYVKAQNVFKSNELGSYTQYDIIPEYIARLKKEFSHLVASPLRMIFDCGNGAAGTVMPQLIEAFEWPHAELLFCEVDGNYPNHEADPIIPENMRFLKDAVMDSGVDLGIGFDGDCDRMAPMSSSGVLVSGDKLLILFAHEIKKNYKGRAIVYDIKCSSAVPEKLAEWGLNPTVCQTGHANLKDAMRHYNAVLGGELSCHFFFADRYFGYDDGIYSALRLLELVTVEKKSLDQLLQLVPQRFSSPEYRIECPEEKKNAAVEQVITFFQKEPHVTLSRLDGIKIETDMGWALVRASNTQSVICLRFEAVSEQALNELKKRVAASLHGFVGQKELGL